MKNILSVVVFASLASVPVLAQLTNCTAPITDNAHVLTSSDVASLSTVISNLKSDGADVHLITDESSTPIENYAPSMARSCRNWQNQAGGVKNNLIVLVNYPRQKKINLVSGSEYNSVLNQRVRDDIKGNFIVPRLKSGAFGAGYLAGLEQVELHLASRTVAAASGSGVPVVIDHSVHAATDYSGFFSFLKWSLFLLFLGGIVFLIIKWVHAQSSRKVAQLNATASRNEVTDTINRLSAKLAEQSALGIAVTKAQGELDLISEHVSAVASNLTNDPTDNKLSKEAYESIDETYTKILAQLHAISTFGDKADATRLANKLKSDKKDAKHAKVALAGDTYHIAEEPTYREPVFSSSSSYSAVATAPVNTTTIIHEDHSNDLLTGVLVGEALSRPSYAEPVYRDPSPSYSHESSDSFSSDSSSSYDSGSNDSFSSDSSSSYDSGGSDSY